MAFNIESTKKITANTSAKTVLTASRTFLICNASEEAIVYFRNNSDGVSCNAGTGFPLFPKQTTTVTISSPTLSVCATDEASVYLLYGEEY